MFLTGFGSIVVLGVLVSAMVALLIDGMLRTPSRAR